MKNNLSRNDTLPFPMAIPDGYLKLENEPAFDANKHLQLEQPKEIVSLAQLGYSEEFINSLPSDFGVSSSFRILSDEGLEIMRELCQKMYSNRNSALGTGNNRLGSYIRGAGYRSQFVKDFCDAPELAEHLSSIVDAPLARHSVPAVACGINYAPEDINRSVDTWHTDSVAFDIVMLLSEPDSFEGGEFQYFHGTREEGQALLGIDGEEGKDAELPDDRVTTVPFDGAGYGFIQQGNVIFHRACKLLKRAERITMIPSFVVTNREQLDGTNSVNMSSWEDPGIVAELARHEAWQASARLEDAINSIELTDSAAVLSQKLHDAISQLQQFKSALDSK